MAFASAAASAARAVDTSARAWRIRSGREPARRRASRSRAASRRLTAVATASLALSTACWLMAWPPTRARARSRSRVVRATSDSAPDSSASAAATSSGRAPRSRSRSAASAAARRARWPSSVAASVACVRMASVSPALHDISLFHRYAQQPRRCHRAHVGLDDLDGAVGDDAGGWLPVAARPARWRRVRRMCRRIRKPSSARVPDQARARGARTPRHARRTPAATRRRGRSCRAGAARPG